MTKVSTQDVSGDTEGYKASEDTDTSVISRLRGTVDRHNILSLQEANHASRVDMGDNREDRGFNIFDETRGRQCPIVYLGLNPLSKTEADRCHPHNVFSIENSRIKFSVHLAKIKDGKMKLDKLFVDWPILPL